MSTAVMSTAVALPPGPDVVRSARRVPAIAAAVALLVGAALLINQVLPPWAYPVCGVAVAGVLLGIARWSGLGARSIGLDRRHLSRAALVGLLGLGLVGLGFGVVLVVPALRTAFAGGGMDPPAGRELLWLALVRVPLGTVILEEIAFRGVLPALFGGGRHWRWRAVLGSAGLFGLWHVYPALALEHNTLVRESLGPLSPAVLPTLVMLAAAGAGVVLYWWRHAGRGLLSPALVHLATNSGALLFAWFLLTYR